MKVLCCQEEVDGVEMLCFSLLYSLHRLCHGNGHAGRP